MPNMKPWAYQKFKIHIFLMIAQKSAKVKMYNIH
jgi:hypothetical protein